MSKIQFFSEEVDFQLKKKTKVRQWIKKVAEKKGAKIKEINYIFCSDGYLKQINIDYLDHHYFTDIITFDNSELEGELEGDVFISIDRIKENSEEFSKTFEQELHRVMIHGVLHLLGFGDKDEKEKEIMRSEEDNSLSLFLTLENH